MRVSYNWLKEYVDIPWPVEELAGRLTMAGLLVEQMEPMSRDLDDIVVAEVLDVAPHPAAGQLLVVRVRAGAEELTVVTGADNVTKGALVPLAKPGARLPGGTVIQRAELRGVVSEGMLCSEAELGTGDDADGIWLLPPDVRHGRPLVEELGLDDVILHLEVYPNRPDCLSVIGVAREVAALTGGRLRLPPAEADELDEPAASLTSVDVQARDLCSRYAARILDGVKIGPSPAWLQQRLRAAGMRPINNVVDVTNYVMW
ncbi:MAG: phenylalanine--tRNA ligase beta subunit-related protein, partial [Limnochordales bacterium]